MSYSHQGVAKALANLHAMALQEQASGRFAELQEFLKWLAELGRGHLPMTDDDHQRFITESAPVLRQGLWHVAAYLADTERMFSRDWYGDEWAQACERRSRIEFVRDFYQGAMPEGALDHWLDTEEIDDRMQQKGEHEGGLEPGEIPEGTPPSHWWWWYPARPPEGPGR